MPATAGQSRRLFRALVAGMSASLVDRHANQPKDNFRLDLPILLLQDKRDVRLALFSTLVVY